MRFFLFTFLSLFLLAGPLYSEYPYNPVVEREVWDKLAPYFIPEEHEAAQALDKIFLSTDRRVTKNLANLKRAGFRLVTFGKYTKTTIVSHHKIPGYLFKIYTDEEGPGNGNSRCLARVVGASLVAEVIEKNHSEEFFKVPKKWIYPIPNGTNHKKCQFLVVAEKMDIYDSKKNKKMWKDEDLVTCEFLERFFLVIKEAGLGDSLYINNIPFCHDKKVAFIDTEWYNWDKIHWEWLRNRLPASRVDFWNSYVSENEK